MRSATSRLVLVLAMVGSARGAGAQLAASELASVSQVVDGTKITVVYSRPRARGRTGLFGTEIKFGHVWTPGANDATTLAITKDVSINGHAVARGKYSVWMVVAPGDWELVLDHDTTLYHTQGPKQRPGQVRFMVPRGHHAFTEVLTWAVPVVTVSGMTLTMQWDTVSVPLEIKVTPSFTTVVAADAGQRVAGTYHWHWAPALANPKPGDSTLTGIADLNSAEATFTVRYVGNQLHATLTPPMFDDPAYGEYLLIQKKDDLYEFGRIDRGEMIEIMDYCAVAVHGGERATERLRGPRHGRRALGIGQGRALTRSTLA